jgi:hypothetical protein
MTTVPDPKVISLAPIRQAREARQKDAEARQKVYDIAIAILEKCDGDPAKALAFIERHNRERERAEYKQLFEKYRTKPPPDDGGPAAA